MLGAHRFTVAWERGFLAPVERPACLDQAAQAAPEGQDLQQPTAGSRGVVKAGRSQAPAVGRQLWRSVGLTAPSRSSSMGAASVTSKPGRRPGAAAATMAIRAAAVLQHSSGQAAAVQKLGQRAGVQPQGQAAGATQREQHQLSSPMPKPGLMCMSLCRICPPRRCLS